MTIIHLTFPAGSTERVIVATDPNGLPRYWAAVWGLLFLGHLAETTAQKKLRDLDDFYGAADASQYNGYLDDVLAKFDVDALGTALEAYFISLKNRPIVTGALEKRWQTVLKFCRDIVLWRANSDKTLGQFKRIEGRLNKLEMLYSQLRIQKTKRATKLRSLPADVVSALYVLLDPSTSENPFKRESVRWTVFIAFLLLLLMGLRRGELTLLRVLRSSLRNRHCLVVFVQQNRRCAWQKTLRNKPLPSLKATG